jgi:hypothetical protein
MLLALTTSPETTHAWRPLGEILLTHGLISELELHDALRLQKTDGGRLGEILFERGLVSAIALRDALAEQHGLDLSVESRAHQRRTASLDQASALPLGNLLVKRGQITETQLDEALAAQARTGSRLGHALIKIGAISSSELASALAEQQGLAIGSNELELATKDGWVGNPRWYEVRETANGTSHRLYASRNFVDATDLAFAILNEWEPEQMHVICVRDGTEEDLCWQYPPV